MVDGDKGRLNCVVAVVDRAFLGSIRAGSVSGTIGSAQYLQT